MENENEKINRSSKFWKKAPIAALAVFILALIPFLAKAEPIPLIWPTVLQQSWEIDKGEVFLIDAATPFTTTIGLDQSTLPGWCAQNIYYGFYFYQGDMRGGKPPGSIIDQKAGQLNSSTYTFLAPQLWSGASGTYRTIYTVFYCSSAQIADPRTAPQQVYGIWVIKSSGTATPPPPLTADFTATPSSGDSPLTVTFVDKSTGDVGEPNGWDWDFGDGSPHDFTKTPSPHTYTSSVSKQYTVTLTVQGFNSTASTASKVITVTVAPPPPTPVVAGFTYTVSDLKVQFTDTSTGSPTSWNWNFGEGTPGSTRTFDTGNYVKTFDYTFANAGTYTITLTASNGGTPSTKSVQITVSPKPVLVADFTYDKSSGAAPLAVQFTDQSSGGTITSWDWDFKDGPSHGTTQNPSHTFSTAGSYAVSLVVKDSSGATSQPAVHTITVTGVGPGGLVASFTTDKSSGAAPLTVQFTDTSTGGAVAWDWDYGDFTVHGTTKDTTHTYNADQPSYTVKLQVFDAANASASATKVITIGTTCNWSGTTYPICTDPNADPDGDGWGWENAATCITQAMCNSQPPPAVITVDPYKVRAIYNTDNTVFQVRQSDNFTLPVKIKLSQNLTDESGKVYTVLSAGDKTTFGGTIDGFYAMFFSNDSGLNDTKTAPLVTSLSANQDTVFNIVFASSARSVAGMNKVGDSYTLDVKGFTMTTPQGKYPLDRVLSATDLRITLTIVADDVTPEPPGGEPGTGGDPIQPKGEILSIIIRVANIILGFIIGFARWIIGLIGLYIVIPVLEATLNMRANDIASNIVVGWTYVRDLSNMFFILILIVIGFATILRIESYNYKKLLVWVIVMALLVNFSLVIGRIIIELADVAQNTFLPTNSTALKEMYKALQNAIGSSAFGTAFSRFDGSTSQELTATGTLVFQLIFDLGIVITFGAMAVFMVIRTVALWILLVLSPFAYVFNILPATKGLAKKWWSNFIKYAFFGAIIAFFLKLSAIMLTKGFNIVPAGLPFSGQPAGSQDLNAYFNNLQTVNFNTFLRMMVIYVVILAFMWAGLIAARSLGIAGANAVVGLAEKGLKAPFRLGAGAGGFLGRRGLGYAGRRWNEMTGKLLEGKAGKDVGKFRKAAFAVLNPVAVARGWEQRSKELKEISKTTAAAGGREVAEQVLTRGKLKIPYRQFAQRQHENEFLKDYQNMRKESLMHASVEAEKLGGAEGEMRRRAIVKAAASQGYLDDLLRMKHFAGKYGDKDGTMYSAGVLNRFLYGYLGKSEQSMRFMAEDMEELGKQSKHYEYLGHAYYDTTDKTFKRGMDVVGTEQGMQGNQVEKLKNVWQAEYASGELAKVGGRERAQIAPHNLVPLRAELDANGNFVESGEELKNNVVTGRKDGTIDEYTASILRVVGDPATLRDIHFAQSRTKNWVLSKDVDQNTGEILVNNEEEYQKIQNLWQQAPGFVKAMYSQHSGIPAEQVSGLRIAYMDKDPATGKVRGKIHKELGDPKSTPPPVSQAVSDEVVQNPVHKLTKDQREKAGDAMKGLIPQTLIGDVDRAKFETALKAKISALNLDDQVVSNMVEDVYDKLKHVTESRYNPRPIISMLDNRLNTRGIPKLDSTQITSISNSISTAVGEAYEESSRRGIKLGLDPALLRAKITDAISRTQNIPTLENDDIELFVQHARPYE